jgi:sugar phosphate isomerase/epimerase
MPEHTPPDASLAPTLAWIGLPPRAGLERLAGLGYRRVQLSAAQETLRPRELDRSGRRELASLLRRLDLAPAGLDVPLAAARLLDPQTADRAVDAVRGAIVLAADLGRAAVSLGLPPEGLALEALVEHALRHGVALADWSVPPAPRLDVAVAIDPPAWAAKGQDPLRAVQEHADRLRSARLPAPADPRFDVDLYRAALRSAGYGGSVVVDLRRAAEPWRDLATAAAGYSARSAAM